jgi:hypothetical protein
VSQIRECHNRRCTGEAAEGAETVDVLVRGVVSDLWADLREEGDERERGDGGRWGLDVLLDRSV